MKEQFKDYEYIVNKFNKNHGLKFREAPKPAVSKVEETNPLVERLVIKELSEKVEVTKVSAKVNEHDAPVTSKSKE